MMRAEVTEENRAELLLLIPDTPESGVVRALVSHADTIKRERLIENLYFLVVDERNNAKVQ